MDGYYRRQSGDGTFSGMANTQNHGNMLTMSPVDAMDGGALLGGDTLDAIIMQNAKEMERRRSAQHNPYGVNQDRAQQQNDPRRASMIQFGANPNSTDLNGYQFEPTSHPQHADGLSQMPNMAQQQMQRADQDLDGTRRQSTGGLAVATQFGRMPYGNMTSLDPFSSPLRQQELTMNPQDTYNSPVAPSPMHNPIAMTFSNNGLDVSGGNMTPINMFAHQQYPHDMSSSHMTGMQQHYADAMTKQPNNMNSDMQQLHNGDGRNEQDVINKMPNLNMSDGLSTSPTGPQLKPSGGETSTAERRRNTISNGSGNVQTKIEKSLSSAGSEQTPVAPSSNGGIPTPSQTESIKLPEGRKKPQNAYSSTGFDMLAVLTKVATRPNPEINIGAVDMSCAFVVCDVGSHDLPIVYCSDIFERMTGYSRHEILGQNCRFLQSPTGKVQSGNPRKYCDDDTVLFLKKRIEQRKEAQAVIINYRKGGHGFQNLLTMIPVTWDTDEIKYFVGFQTDLVEKPNSIISKNNDGTYSTNYQRGYVPRYVWSEPDNRRHQLGESGHTIGRDDVSTVLTTISSGESELSRRIWDKVLLENTDDVVHVLSLKGLFLYLSPSSRKILEYDSSELVGTALSSVCHPSDIVPVTRELRDTSSGAPVNVVFRIRRKHSGYTWFESHGSLHTEQGKGRKCIILVGRERPVYALSRNDIDEFGGIGDSELWSKMSTSGMFLFVSSNSRQVLDRQPEDLIGTSIQALMRPESKIEFGRILEQVRSGKRAQFKHEMQNRRGQVLHAQSTLYPGDASEGAKPTFLVCQTNFLRPSRSTTGSAVAKGPASVARSDPTSSSGTLTNNTGAIISTQSARRLSSPRTLGSAPTTNDADGSTPTNKYDPITSQAGGSGLPIGTQDIALASELNVFDELKTTRSTSWQFELRQMEKKNRALREELEGLQSARRKRKRRKGQGHIQKECANCHTKSSPEWRRGPSGNRDLCNSCGLRWTKLNGRTSPRSQQSGGNTSSPNQNNSPHSGEPANSSNASKLTELTSAPGGTDSTRDQQTEETHQQTHPPKTHSYDSASATRPPKIEEQDEGTLNNGVF